MQAHVNKGRVTERFLCALNGFTPIAQVTVFTTGFFGSLKEVKNENNEKHGRIPNKTAGLGS